MITYDQVRGVVEALRDQGIHPSRKRVRRALGGTGSYETIGKYTAQALTELGVEPLPAGEEDEEDGEATPARYTPPEPDAALVARHLATLRDSTAFLATVEHLQHLTDSFRACVPLIPRARNAVGRRRSAPGIGLGDDSGLSSLVGQDVELVMQRCAWVLAQLT